MILQSPCDPPRSCWTDRTSAKDSVSRGARTQCIYLDSPEERSSSLPVNQIREPITKSSTQEPRYFCCSLVDKKTTPQSKRSAINKTEFLGWFLSDLGG